MSVDFIASKERKGKMRGISLDKHIDACNNLDKLKDLALPSRVLYVPLNFLKWKAYLDILHGCFWI
ncbi:hypothetical protein HAX54_019929, partial [Datura stramonium]|nr:hypothetical protein [Datura stramonium]